MSAERGDLEQNLIPKYKFKWADGTERTTEDLPEQMKEAIEVLAELGERDPDCEVTLVGYST